MEATKTRRTQKQNQEYLDNLCERYVKILMNNTAQCKYKEEDIQEKINDLILSEDEYRKKYRYSEIETKLSCFMRILFLRKEHNNHTFKNFVNFNLKKDKIKKFSIIKKAEEKEKNSNSDNTAYDDYVCGYDYILDKYLYKLLDYYSRDWNALIEHFKEDEIMLK
jgi:hypothetical protein